MEFGQARGERRANSWQMAQKSKRDVAQRLRSPRLHQRGGCHPVGEAGDVASYSPALGSPSDKPNVITVLQSLQKVIDERCRILNAGVHSLAAHGAKNVRGVAAKENPAFSKGFDNTRLNSEE